SGQFRPRLAQEAVAERDRTSSGKGRNGAPAGLGDRRPLRYPVGHVALRTVVPPAAPALFPPHLRRPRPRLRRLSRPLARTRPPLGRPPGGRSRPSVAGDGRVSFS